MIEARAPWGRRGDARLPVVSSVAIALLQVFGTVGAAHNQPDRVPLDALGYALLLAGPAMLLLRCRRPAAVMVGTTAVTVGYLLGGYPYGPVFTSMGVAFFVAVQRGRRRVAWACAAAFYAAHLLIGYVLPADWLRTPGSRPGGWQELGVTAVMLLLATGAEFARIRREQITAARAAAREARHRRADEERLRMARELHDILAHSISLIHVQAGVALELMDTRPEQARSALTTIKAASKEALTEVRQVLGTLRGPEAAAPRAPAPGLDRLDELVDQARHAGLAVTLRTEGEPARLPAAVELAAFRIVQEALTNVLRHSAARTATVLVGYAEDGLTVQVDDPGPAGGGDAGGSGTGLVGMRERATALGGTLEAGPNGAGFRVRARLGLRPGRGDG